MRLICIFLAFPLLLAASALSESGRNMSALARLKLVESALAHYSIDTRRYPTTHQGLAAPLENPGDLDGWRGPYLRARSSLLDPWGKPFIYVLPASQGDRDYYLYSIGVNGADDHGGVEDITAWAVAPEKYYPRPFPWFLAAIIAGFVSCVSILVALATLVSKKLRSRAAV